MMILGLAAWTSMHGQIVINEINAANADGIYDTYFYNYSPWIELYNSGSSSVNVGGYFLSDDISAPYKWTIPANTSIPGKGFLMIWCDNAGVDLHANFSLDSDGEDVVLSNASFQNIDQVNFPKQYTNLSYGRLSNGGAVWGHQVNATPGASNNPATGTDRLKAPEFSKAAGRYVGVQTVTITHEQSNAEIHYTIDGSEPTAGSKLYNAPVQISFTNVLKAKAFQAGSLPSKTSTATYFIGEHKFTLPVVSITTKTSYLWDDKIGIYADGTNGIIANCTSAPMNWNQDWDRHAVFEYFNADGTRRLDQDIDIRIGGACSRNYPQKSFVVKARDKYGKKTINENFFSGKDVSQFGGFILRNSGNDFNITHFRDALEHALVADQMDIDYLAYQPTTFYLNGQYWGIQNIREKIDADYIEANYGIKKDDIDLLETWEVALEGTTDAYLNYKNTLAGMDRSTEAAFEYIDQHIEVQEYINYLVTEIYYGNTDWPGNNMKFWRQRSTNGKFRWILWDMDFGFALFPWSSSVTHPTLNFATEENGPGWPNPPWSTQHIRMVLENPQFRMKFIQTLNAAMNTTFAPDRVVGMINTFQNRIAAEMPYHKQKWGGTMDDFNASVQFLRDFAVQRNTFMRQHTAEFFGLSDNISMTIKTDGGGNFKLNGLKSESDLINSSYFQGLPFTVEPIALPGYKFKQWTINDVLSTNLNFITRGDTWKYYDQAPDPGASWKTNGFNDATWSSGLAQLGYGENDEQTVTGYGPDPNNKYITTYFRKSFNVADTTGVQPISGEVLFDDGVVVYLNGTEIFRNNMPAGTIGHTTTAAGTLQIENTFYAFQVPKSLLKPGVNVLAAEVHQSAVNSSDVSFELSLRSVQIGSSSTRITTNPIVSDTAYSNIELEASFEVDDRFVSGLVINEISASPSDVLDPAGEAEDWIELYNAGSTAINLAGLYLTDDVTSKTKHKIAAGSGSEMTLAPGAYKIFWADDEAAEGVDHVKFKLSADGEAVGIYQEVDGNIYPINVMTYGMQSSTGSYSRIPNGTGDFTFTAALTPGATNMLVTSVEENEIIGAYPNPVGAYLNIKTSSPVEKAELIDCYGQTVRSYQHVRSDEALLVSDIKPGFYLLRVRSANRWHVTKIVKQ